MSDQEIGKKEVERKELYPFLDAYEWVASEHLSLVECGESPDFICKRPDGSDIGVELTKVTREPDIIFGESVLDQKEEIDPYEALEYIHYLIEKKEKARTAHYITRVKENILVLQLVDGSLDALRGVIDGLQADFTDHGFSEIWLADYSGLEAYGDIELFGLYPVRIWGYHQRPWPDRKPYG
jgi:hypothetical protein